MDAPLATAAPPWDSVASSLVHAEQELARLGQFVDGLTGQLDELWTEFDTRRDHWLQEREAEEQRLAHERAGLAEESARLAATAEQQGREEQSLAVDLAAAQRVLEQRERELVDARQRLAELQAAQETGAAQANDAVAKLETVLAELGEAQQRYVDLEARLTQSTNDRTAAEDILERCSQLEQELAAARAERDALSSATQSRDAEASQQVDELRQALERTREELASRQQQWQTERGEAVETWRAKVDALQNELNDSRAQQARFAQVAVELADARTELAQAREELRQERVAAATATREGLTPESERQIAELQKQRGALEQELESVRYRAAELAETAAEERRRMAEERSAWASELKALRKTLENPGPRREPLRTAEPALTTTTPSEAAARDTVLESVMAQFEKLQKDAVARRGRPAVQRQ